MTTGPRPAYGSCPIRSSHGGNSVWGPQASGPGLPLPLVRFFGLAADLLGLGGCCFWRFLAGLVIDQNDGPAHGSLGR